MSRTSSEYQILQTATTATKICKYLVLSLSVLLTKVVQLKPFYSKEKEDRGEGFDFR
jgi:hypothetical protein